MWRCPSNGNSPSFTRPIARRCRICWACATSRPACRSNEIDKNIKPGDVNFIARTKDAYVYEYPNALPRVLLPICALRADFAKMIEEGGWPEVDFREAVLLEESPICHRQTADQPATARIVSYENTKVVIEAEAPPRRRLGRAERRLASLLVRASGRRSGPGVARQRAVPRGGGARGPARSRVPLRAAQGAVAANDARKRRGFVTSGGVHAFACLVLAKLG